MKKSMALALVLLATVICHAQRDKDVPAFGKVEKADLELKECDFDKNAEALVLFDVAELYCNILGTVQIDQERHVRIKILKDKGKDRGDVKIRYWGFKNNEQIKNLQA